MQWSLPADVVDTDKLQQRGVDEAHANAVPHVHRRQVRHHRKRAAETVGGGEKIQHGRDASPAGFNGAGNGLVLDQVRIQSRQRRALPESVLVVLPDIPYR